MGTDCAPASVSVFLRMDWQATGSQELLCIKRFQNKIVVPIGHFGVWSQKHNCRVDSAVALEDSHLYRCSVDDMYEVMARMSDLDATNFVEDILVWLENDSRVKMWCINLNKVNFFY